MTKKNLGQLFGGKIVSINYNFQTSNQPSTATVTVVNETQTYQTPEFGSTVSIPPFGIQMDVVSIGQIKSAYKHLQVELVEKSHEILDKELILIYGLHTTHQSELNKDIYWTFKSYFVDDQYWSSPRNPKMQSPVYTNKRSENGLNVLGFARASINDLKGIPINGDFEFVPDTTSLKFDKGVINTEVSTASSSNWVFDESGPSKLSIEYGYTLSELRALLIRLGIKFLDNSDSFLIDDNVLFSSAGTVREVLSSVLSKIGMSFYVEPISQKIKIITNSDIAKMNANILSTHKDFNEPCASQLSYFESVKDVNAPHVVLKGEFNRSDDEAPSQFNFDPPKRRDRLFRVSEPDITGLDERQLNYIYRFLPLSLLGLPDETIKAYIYGTAVYENSDIADWGELYGKEDLEVSIDDYWKENGTFDAEGNPANAISKFWNEVEKEGTINYFDPKTDGETAKLLFKRVKGKGGNVDPTSPSDKYIPFIHDFAKMWGGIYISDAMNEREANTREYLEVTRKGKSVVTFTADSASLITEHDQLSFLVNLLKQGGHPTKVTIKDLALHTKAKHVVTVVGSDPLQSGSNVDIKGTNFHVIAIVKEPLGREIENLPEDTTKYIGSNLQHIEKPAEDKPTIPKSETFVLGSKGFKPMMTSLRKNFSLLLKASAEERDDYINISFFKLREDNTTFNSGDENPFLDIGTPNFLRNIESDSKCFYQRSLEILQMGQVEAQLFLDNFGDLNPAVPCPLISSSIKYERPPSKDDFNIENGLNSISIAITAGGGITTTIAYSSRKFARIEKSIARDYLGASQTKASIPYSRPNYGNAASKNLRIR